MERVNVALVPQKVTPPPDPKTLQGFLTLRSQHLADLLPKSAAFSADKFIKLALLAEKKNSDLAKCGMQSVYSALLTVAELGLDPSGSTGEAYLIPYGNVCTLVIGYRGYITLARRSGQLKQIESHIVHERDKFELAYGFDPKLEHIPNLGDDPGKPILAYCIARLADEAIHAEHMTVREINKIRDSSKASKKGPWVDHWEEMARKTVLRRTAKYLPLSSEMQKALEVDDEADAGGNRIVSGVSFQQAGATETTVVEGELVNAATGETAQQPVQQEPQAQQPADAAAAGPTPGTQASQREVLGFEELAGALSASGTRRELQELARAIEHSKQNGRLTQEQRDQLLEIYKAKSKAVTNG